MCLPEDNKKEKKERERESESVSFKKTGLLTEILRGTQFLLL